MLIRTCEIQIYEPRFIKSITDGDASNAVRQVRITQQPGRGGIEVKKASQRGSLRELGGVQALIEQFHTGSAEQDD